MIPDIRKGVLSVEKAAECLEEYEKEATLTAKEKSKGVSEFVLAFIHVLFLESFG